METHRHRPPAFVLGMTINGLSILRSLGRRGVVCYGIDSDCTKIGFFSRYCRRRVLIRDPLDDPESALDRVLRVASGLGLRPALYLTSDDYLALVARRYNELHRFFLHSLPRPEVIATILDKRRLARAAAAAGIPCPRTLDGGSVPGLDCSIPPLRFPVIVKPAESHLGRRSRLFHKTKAIIVPDIRGLSPVLRAAREAGIETLIQELVPGPDSNISLFYAYYPCDGGTPVVFTKRKLRQYPIHFGYGCANESLRQPEVIRLGRMLMEALSYRGLGGVEFKRDSVDGLFKLIEIHGRTPMTGELAVASGIDLPWIAYCDMTGETVEKPREFAEGVKWFRVRHDLAAFRQYRRDSGLSFRSWIRSYRGRKVFSTFSRRDPLPLMKRWAWEMLGPLKRSILRLLFR
jgi:D-aspartate ligase